MLSYKKVSSFVAPLIVSLEQVKAHLKVEPDYIEEDTLIQVYIDAAVSYVSNYLCRSVQDERYEVYGDSFESLQCFEKQRLKQIQKVKYKDEFGVYKVLEAAHYVLDGVSDYRASLRYTKALPVLAKQDQRAVKMIVTCGFETVPKEITQAILLLVGDFYEYRTDRPKKQRSVVENLICSHKCY